MTVENELTTSTIGWVKEELNATLARAREALEAHVEQSGGGDQLESCAGCLHQVQGTLRMVELHGAALVAEEMEKLATACATGEAGNPDDAYGVLMRGIVQLPDYLDRLASGYRDIPIVLLSLLNDLRAARGGEGLSESTLFAPPLDVDLPEEAAGPASQLSADELTEEVSKLRLVFEGALVRWFKGADEDQALARMGQVLSELTAVTSVREARRLWWVGAAVAEGLAQGAIQTHPGMKKLIGAVDRQIKRLLDQGEDSFREQPPDDLCRSLLYYVAFTPESAPRMSAVRDAFQLHEWAPGAAEMAHAQGSMSGHNRELLTTVGGAITEDLLQVKDALDLYLRTGDSEPSGLAPHSETLKRVADTLGMIGLGDQREEVLRHCATLNDMAGGAREVDESALMEIASALLFVESCLDDYINSLGAVAQGRPGEADAADDAAKSLPRAEMERITQALLAEAVGNLNRAKEQILAFVGAPWDHERLRECPALMDEAAGALRMLEKDQAADLLTGVARYLERRLLEEHSVPSAAELDTLADAIESMEYYLEGLTDRRPGTAKALEVARERVAELDFAAPEAAEDETPAKTGLDVVDLAADGSAAPRYESGASVSDLGEDTQAAEKAVPGPEVDDDIREVFIDEFAEELESLNELYPRWKADTDDTGALASIRRSFHTLKGSGRLVGALVLGEFSWKIENMLNRVLEGSRTPTPALFGLMDQVIFQALPQLLEELRGEAAVAVDVEGLKTTADAIASGEHAEEPEDQTSGASAAAAGPTPDDEPVTDKAAADLEPKAPREATEPTDHTAEFVEEWTRESGADASDAAHEERAPAQEPADEALAGEPGGGMDPALYEVFQKEADAHLLALSVFLDHARPRPEKTPVGEELTRSLHTLNGAASMAGVGALAQLMDPVEDYTKRLVLRGDYLAREGFEALEEALQAAEVIVRQAGEARPDYPDTRALRETLDRLLDATPESPGEAPAPGEFTPETKEQDADGAQRAETAAPEREHEDGGGEAEADPGASASQDAGAEAEAGAQSPVWDETPATADETASTEETAATEPAESAEESAETAEDLDTELLEIFLEEGTEILDEADGLMQRWRKEPGKTEVVAELQRDLHTLKGGARMAGLSAVGDLGHVLESLFEAINDGQVETGEGVFERIEGALDRLHRDMETARGGRVPDYPTENIARIEALLKGDSQQVSGFEGAAAAETEAPAKPRLVRFTQEDVAQADLKQQQQALAGGQELIRVRADLLESLVNSAGEVSIYRSRLEQQVGAIRFNLVEFAQTITRLREQLRKLEIETEAQILSRLQREGALPDDEELNLEHFDPLELDRFSQLQQYSRALAESVTDLVNIEDILSDLTRESETLLLQQSRISSDLQEGLMRTRMVPFSSQVPRLRRLLRRTADELDRKASLEVTGAEGEMDRTVLERMTAPLEHMLRNALAHGIESPADRKRAGKAETGQIHIDIGREASEVIIEVSDDGRGIDLEGVRKTAVKRGLLRKDAELTDHDILAFILETGFSTAEEVSKVAGRGVGMDVVHAEIKQLSGSLDIHSETGHGTRFTVRLPFTLAVTQALMVRAGEENYAVPLSGIEGVVRVERDEFMALLNQGEEARLQYGGEDYEVQDLSVLLGHDSRHAGDPAYVPVLIVRTGDRRAAVRVDELLGSREVVVKSVGPQLSTVPGIFGATILGDGSVILILDLLPLVRRGAAMHLLPDEMRAAREEVEQDLRPTIMVVDDSITMRKVTSRILERHDMQVMTAKDGVDAVAMLQENMPDVMLLDIEMPRMDGYELATHIRNDSRLKNIPIIMITSRTGLKHRERAEGLGVNKYMGKPYQEADLMQHINELLEGAGGAA